MRDPQSSLEALDECQARYPAGRLHSEASILRADALAALDRRAEALSILDSLDLARMPGSDERHAQRGELRFSLGRYQDAEADFEKVIARHRTDDDALLERGLWGRARCRERLGKSQAARDDAKVYVRRFPAGRFAAEAELLLLSTDSAGTQ